MCYYYEYAEKYDDCENDPKHIIKTRRYDRSGCEKAAKSGFHCDEDAKPMKGKNGEQFQLGSTRKEGKCPRCLS
jgi:hypothetical protein